MWLLLTCHQLLQIFCAQAEVSSNNYYLSGKEGKKCSHEHLNKNITSKNTTEVENIMFSALMACSMDVAIADQEGAGIPRYRHAGSVRLTII
jgi:hypothetical protein